MEFEVEHTDEGLRAAYLEWWQVRFGRASRISFVTLVGLVTVMLLFRSTHWVLVAAATAVACYAALLASIRDQSVELALQNVGVIGRKFRYRASEDSLTEESSVGVFQMRWAVFARVVRQREHLVLLRKPEAAHTFVALPLSQVPPEFEALARARIGSL